jgi:hypothetical protein
VRQRTQDRLGRVLPVSMVHAIIMLAFNIVFIHCSQEKAFFFVHAYFLGPKTSHFSALHENKDAAAFLFI